MNDLIIKIQSLNILELLNGEILFIQDHLNNQFLFILFVIFSVLLVFKFLKRNYYVFALFSIFGTIMHEATHFIVSLFTNGQPTSFSILPRRSDNGIVLGYVESRNVTWYNGAFIGLAPLLLLPLAYIFFRNDVLFETELLMIFIKSYLLASLIEGSIPSITDIMLVVKKSFFILVILGIFIFLKFL